MLSQDRFIRLYTGNGQGKRTAAFGVAVRVLCAGGSVYIGQFVKDMAYSETALQQHFDHLKIEQLGVGCFIDRNPCETDRHAAQQALRHCAQLMHSGQWDLVVLDELTIALHYQLLTVAQVLEALQQRSPHTEVIITGRYAPQALIDAAHLVTEMHEVKHYYATLGVTSREGFDC